MTNKNEEIERLVKERKLRVVDLSILHTDPSYQRDIKNKHRKILAEFDEDSLGVPLIGERSDGSLWIVDGLQRVTVLRKLGWTQVRADVFRSDGSTHEAQVFKRVNLDRTALRPLEQFKARLAAQDEVAIAILKAVQQEGYKIAGKTHPEHQDSYAKQIGAVNTLVAIYEKFGADHIRFALKVADACWPGDKNGTCNRMLMGLALFYHRYDESVDWERLVPRFQSVTAQRVLYAANQTSLSGGSGNDLACAEQLSKLYNKRYRKK